MGVYTRFKKAPGGFRALVELLETTPLVRRQKMIDVGMQEDREYTEKALQFCMNFEDVLELNESELAEVLSSAPPRIVAFAIKYSDAEIQKRFMRCSKPPIASEIRDCLTQNIGKAETGGAQLKMVEYTRQLEKRGLITAKRIPEST